MLKKSLVIFLICASELLVLFLLRPQTDPGGEVVALNALVQMVKQADGDYGSIPADAAFTVLGADGAVLFRSRPDIPVDPLTAAAEGAAVLPVQLADGQGFVITDRALNRRMEVMSGRYFTLALLSVLISGTAMLGYTFWLDRRILRPFRNIRRTAEEIARGNLDVPLRMDRGGVFGAFTESFDLMRAELARAHAAEARAAAAKKDLIAGLSHDLRTPIASIRAVAELGALTADAADQRRFGQITGKTAQLALLVSNLLDASLEEQTELAVTLRTVSTAEIRELLEGADYNHWMKLSALPERCVLADPVRLQQIFDNLFANAYKYGRRPVCAAGFIQEGELLLEIEDAGGGVPLDEVSSLHLRCYRGRNSAGEPGAGLGLHICDQLVRAMNGELLIRNGQTGLQVTVILPLIHS